MRTISAADLLALWERGASRHPLDRSALLYACARPDQPTDAIADLRLSEINRRLLELRAAWFGDRIDAHVECEHCGERLGLTIAVHELLRPANGSTPGEVTVKGLRCRPPSLRDLAAIAGERDGVRAAHRLLERCLLDGDGSIAVDDDRLRDVEEALEEIDPDADFGLNVRCEACGQSGTAELDPGALLWDEISGRARALLGEVHQLAFAYGWSERDILALTPERRASYLSMVAP
jgi:hypothetical protein